uniref:Uncharacterized protein n=1 Tax=Salix viminalis TaxID=40686 RepID=A0A6N2L2N8_SALVM
MLDDVVMSWQLINDMAETSSMAKASEEALMVADVAKIDNVSWNTAVVDYGVVLGVVMNDAEIGFEGRGNVITIGEQQIDESEK